MTSREGSVAAESFRTIRTSGCTSGKSSAYLLHNCQASRDSPEITPFTSRHCLAKRLSPHLQPHLNTKFPIHAF
ncbi:hypothetical protein M758_4G153900 [Ceratodon purpureus]|nr:hypothetical protein M758_4G153900 [Ceratodon purpureus]